MNLHWFDWSIVGALLFFLLLIAVVSKYYTRSVADFLASNRCAGRYVIALSFGMASMGAISILANWEMAYKVGFTGGWWGTIVSPVGMLIILTGFGIYRYRQTRAMTMAQFIAIRYSNKLRIFVGILSFVSGVFMTAIYPAVATRFIIYFGGLPPVTPTIFGDVSTFAVLLAALLITGLSFAILGGQIAVVLTDFFQGLFVSIVTLVILIFVFVLVDWSQMSEAFAKSPPGQSMINPFHTAAHRDFNMWYFVIAAVARAYTVLAFQGASGYTCAAINAHEAKMAGIIGSWKFASVHTVNTLLPIIIYVWMLHPSHAGFAEGVNNTLSSISNSAVASQMTVPIGLSKLLPVGFRGALCAVVIAAFISTSDSCLHSWGSIFLQDIIMPFRKKPFDPKRHLWYLRLSIIAVAVIMYFIAVVYRPTQAILMFFAIGASIFVSGAGIIILCGLYWKKGTTAAGWTAMIVGSVISVTTIVLQQIWKSKYNAELPINSQYMFAFAMGMSTLVYVVISLVQNRTFNIDRMLHRGKYTIEKPVEGDAEEANVKGIPKFLVKLGLTHEFNKWDKFIFYMTLYWSLSWFGIVMVMTAVAFIFDFDNSDWLIYWKINVWVMFAQAFSVTVWFAIGGIRDVAKMLQRLKTAVRNVRDDGMVIDHRNLDEIEADKLENL